MGHIARQVSANTTRYYWYPGDKREWARAAVAVALGAAVAGIVATMSHGLLAAAVAGASTTAVLAGFNVGRRDSRALNGDTVLGRMIVENQIMIAANLAIRIE